MSQPATAKTPRRLGPLRYAALGALIPCALLLLGEVGLRLFGIGADERTSALAYQEVFPPALVPAERPDGEPILRTWDPRHPWQAVRATKPANSLRVLCFGGSAAAGLGHSPNVTFARQLEDLLRAAYPKRTVEVVNLGIVGIAARQVRVLLEDALATCAPDLVVVYSGNNEYLAVHAASYFSAHSSWHGRLADQIRSLNTVRALRRGLSGPRGPSSVPLRDLTLAEEERLTHSRFVREIELGPEEHTAALAVYGAELEATARAGQRAGVPVLIVGVAVNWEWVAPEGLPEGWIAELLGRPGTAAEAQLELERRLAGEDLSPYERWQSLTRLATALDLQGDATGATEAWRRSSDVDPHQRRATSAHLAAARAAAFAAGAPFLDAVALCVADDPRARVGFRHFYDYVHFTPRGAMVVADGVFRAMQELFPAEVELPRGSGGLTRLHEKRLARIATASADFVAREEFIGFCFDPKLLASTDLWKYDTAVRSLDDRLAKDPDDWRALAYRANAQSFTQDGADAAERDWRRAKDLSGEPEARAALEESLEWLRAWRQ